MAIHKFTRLILEGKPIPFFGTGSTARDYTYIDDIIQGVVAAIDRRFDFEVFNLGESTTVTLQVLVEHLESICGRKAHLQRLPPQPGDVEITYADVSKARGLLGYQPTTGIEDGLKRFVEWFERYKDSI
jgi:UDP-glucuronate 4-epimerase